MPPSLSVRFLTVPTIHAGFRYLARSWVSRPAPLNRLNYSCIRCTFWTPGSPAVPSVPADLRVRGSPDRVKDGESTPVSSPTPWERRVPRGDPNGHTPSAWVPSPEGSLPLLGGPWSGGPSRGADPSPGCATEEGKGRRPQTPRGYQDVRDTDVYLVRSLSGWTPGPSLTGPTSVLVWGHRGVGSAGRSGPPVCHQGRWSVQVSRLGDQGDCPVVEDSTPGTGVECGPWGGVRDESGYDWSGVGPRVTRGSLTRRPSFAPSRNVRPPGELRLRRSL